MFIELVKCNIATEHNVNIFSSLFKEILDIH